MQKILVIILPVLLIFSCKMKEKNTDHVFEVIPVNYPETKTVDVEDDYHGTKVADPYRWLEVDTAAEVETWVKQQNEATYGYLEKIPFREAIKNRYQKLFNYEKLSAPMKVGDHYFFYKNDGLQNQAVIYVQKGLDGTPEVFIDPNALSKDGTTAISLLGGSTNDKYMAYAQQEAGSDWQQIKVMEIDTRKEMPDQLKWVKFSGAAWDENGFFYSRYPEPKEGLEYSQDIKFHSIYYHKLGEDQSKDKLIYQDEKHPDMYHWCNTTNDDKYLIMYAAPGTDGYATYYMDLSKPERLFEELFPGYANKTTIVDHHEGSFLSLTDIDAPNYRLVSVDPARKEKANWKEILPEKDDLLESVSTGGGKLFAKYLTKATNRVFQMKMDGTRSNVIELPGTGSTFGFSGEKDQKDLFYTYTSFVYPSIIFKYNVETTKSEPFFESKLAFDPSKFEEKQIMYKSKDGTEVSMFIVHKKGLELNGNNPTFLYGYGGFNNSMTPYFSASRVILLENGGVFAMPNLRGGGEYGEEWHKDGMLFKKQNVFDDFIAAAEYLIAEKYTSSDKLAIAGGSNGGLLVGACMTQRPELFAVTFPAVGVMDMLRYHKFTVGKGWIPEYGSSDEADHFKNLFAYSPLHNIEDGVEYPATMITTADHDDRVVPAHSFKFAATLQKANKGDNPTLIRIETNAGHGAGKPTSKIIEEQADQWSFFFQNTESPVKY